MSEASVPMWRKIVAGFLDLLTAFLGLGYLIALLTGGLTDGGFQLSGLPALILFALVVAYFWVGNKYLGGTIWKRILKA